MEVCPVVALNWNGGHDHGEGDVCPACRFREVLARFLEAAHDDGRDEWHFAVGDLRGHMHAALLALDAIESRPFRDEGEGDIDPAVQAAAAIVQVAAEIEELRWELLGPGPEGE